MKKRLFLAALAACLMIQTCPTYVTADQLPQEEATVDIDVSTEAILLSGDCSETSMDHVKWKVVRNDETGVLKLVVSGSGMMKSFYEIPEIGSSGLTEVVEQQLLEKNLIDKSSYIEEIEICKGVKSVGALMNSRAKKIYLPDGLEQIDEGALCDCEELVELRIPDSLKWVGDYSLYNCSKLEKIELPEGVIELGDMAFGMCSSLKELRIPEGLETVYCSLWDDCTGLEKIYLPHSLKKFYKDYSGENQTDGCPALADIYFEGTEDEWAAVEMYSVDENWDGYNESSKWVKSEDNSLGDEITLRFQDAQPTPTEEPEATATPVPTEEPEATATPVPTEEPEATVTPAPTEEPKATATPVPTEEPEATATPVPTEEPEATATPVPTEEPEATATPVPTEEPEEKTVRVKYSGAGLSLNGKIGAVVFLEVKNADVSGEDSLSVIISRENKEDEILRLSELKHFNLYDKEIYEVPVFAAPKEYSDTISLSLVDGDKNELPVTVGGKELSSYDYSIKAITDKYLANPSLYGESTINLVKAIRNYCGYSMLMTGYKTENAKITDKLKDITADNLIYYAPEVTGNKEIAKYKGLGLGLKADMTMQVYFSLSDAPEDYTIELLGCKVVPEKISDDTYCVDVTDISGGSLATRSTIKIKKGDECCTIKVSALSWAQSVLSRTKGHNKNTVNLAKMLYRYQCAYDRYFCLE
uniref:Uncharacterized protein n=1 Tax=Eubacterium cellulosolvens (strain ATCC 43171 / JCM 9499 / 6) TaxID=633697 RepID=I5ARA3_EUBC6